MSTRFRSLKSISGDRVPNKIQDYIESALDPVLASQIIDGVLLTNVKLTAGANEISHRLDRRLTGWMVVRKRANADIWDEQDTNNRATKTLKLQASANVTVDLWVF